MLVHGDAPVISIQHGVLRSRASHTKIKLLDF